MHCVLNVGGNWNNRSTETFHGKLNLMINSTATVQVIADLGFPSQSLMRSYTWLMAAMRTMQRLSVRSCASRVSQIRSKKHEDYTD